MCHHGIGCNRHYLQVYHRQSKTACTFTDPRQPTSHTSPPGKPRPHVPEIAGKRNLSGLSGVA